jgi:hypothetical protein
MGIERKLRRLAAHYYWARTCSHVKYGPAMRDFLSFIIRSDQQLSNCCRPYIRVVKK